MTYPIGVACSLVRHLKVHTTLIPYHKQGCNEINGGSSLIHFACIGVAPLDWSRGSNSNADKMDQI